MPDFVLATAADRDGIVGAVGGLPQKMKVMKEEGIRVVCVPAPQSQVASRYASEGMYVIAAARSHDFSNQLEEANLLRLVNDVRPGPWYSRRTAIAVATVAPFAFGLLGWSMTPGFAWQTRAITYHKEQGLDRFETLSQEIFPATENAGGTISFPAMMIALGKVGEGAHVGIDPAIVRTAIERLVGKTAGTSSGIEGLSKVEADKLVATLNAADFEFVTEREKFMTEMAIALRVDRDRLEIREASIVAYARDGIATVHYDGKVFDHVGSNGGALWRSAARKGLNAETAIKMNPAELCYFTKLTEVTTKVNESEMPPISFELNTSGFGVIPVTERGDAVELFIKCMPQSRWFPLAGIDHIGDIGMSVTTMVRRPLANAKPGQRLQSAIQAIYVNGFQDQSLRGGKTDWWGGRFTYGTLSGDVSVAFSNIEEEGPLSGQVTIEEPKFLFAESERDAASPEEKRIYRDGNRDWVVRAQLSQRDDAA